MDSLAYNIVSGKAIGTEIITLHEFKLLYKDVERFSKEKNQLLEDTYILLLTEVALVRFDINENFVLRVTKSGKIVKKDFDIVISPVFEGNVHPIPWRAFIWTEIVTTWWFLLPFGIVFYSLISQDIKYSTNQQINQMLVEANALFVGIFILFTISQNRDLLISRELVKKGITHQLIQNDFYIASFSIISLILAFFSMSVISSMSNWSYGIFGLLDNQWYVIIKSLPYLFTTISLILLIDCLWSVTRYYLRVLRTAIEGKMYIDWKEKS